MVLSVIEYWNSFNWTVSVVFWSDPCEQCEPHSGDDWDGSPGLEWPRKSQDHDVPHPSRPLCRSDTTGCIYMLLTVILSPSIIYTCWSLSQHTLSGRQGAPRKGCQSIWLLPAHLQGIVSHLGNVRWEDNNVKILFLRFHKELLLVTLTVILRGWGKPRVITP